MDEIKAVEWGPKGYDPGISVEMWKKLLENPDIFNDKSIEMMHLFKMANGESTCKQLGEKIGQHPSHFIGVSNGLVDRILKRIQCPPSFRDDGTQQYWPVLYLGKGTIDKESGAFVWKLRPELDEALGDYDGSVESIMAESQRKKLLLLKDKLAEAQNAYEAILAEKTSLESGNIRIDLVGKRVNNKNTRIGTIVTATPKQAGIVMTVDFDNNTRGSFLYPIAFVNGTLAAEDPDLMEQILSNGANDKKLMELEASLAKEQDIIKATEAEIAGIYARYTTT